MPSIKAQNFNAETLIRQARGRSPNPPSIAQGIPINNGQTNGTLPKILAMQGSLASSGLLNPDSVSNSALDASLNCLNAICVTIERDLDPHLSLLSHNKTKIDNPNIENPQLLKEKKILNDGAQMFPQASDPWHEHDEGPPRYLKPAGLARAEKIASTDPVALVNQVYLFNMRPKIPDNAKLKQFMFDQNTKKDH